MIAIKMLPSNRRILILLLYSLGVIELSCSSFNKTQIYYSEYPNILYQYILRGLVGDHYFKEGTTTTVDDGTNEIAVPGLNGEFDEEFKTTHFAEESIGISLLIEPTSSSTDRKRIPLSENGIEDNEVSQGLQKMPSFSSPSLERNTLETSQFFVITAIFNPVSYQSRYNLYYDFAKHMNETGAQLITIECIFPSLNQHEFQVTDSKNPNHIQLKSESIYWMKENLINIAVSKLPSHAKWVCWLDADISFEEPNWVTKTINELKKYTIVQIFEKSKFLGPSPENEVLRIDFSFGYSVIHGNTINQGNEHKWPPQPGYGWAMSVEDYRLMNGLPDYNIVGSGDRFFAFSLINKISESFKENERTLNLHLTQMISDVSNQTFIKLKQLSESNLKEIVGYVPITICHHWHGSTKDRQYSNRWRIFKDNNYNFITDVKTNSEGLFLLNPNKPKLQADLIAFFEKRHEDTNETDKETDRRNILIVK